MKNATSNESSTNHVTQHDYIKLGVLSHITSKFFPHPPTYTRLVLEVPLKKSSSNKANNGESSAPEKREKFAVAKSKLVDAKAGEA